jgi:hypothetical protein
LIKDNDLSGGTSGYIMAYDLLWVNETRYEGNTVNADQSIGVLLLNSDVVGPGVTCAGNTPPAVFNGPARGESKPCPPS